MENGRVNGKRGGGKGTDGISSLFPCPLWPLFVCDKNSGRGLTAFYVTYTWPMTYDPVH